jgi:hypothetical protein
MVDATDMNLLRPSPGRLLQLISSVYRQDRGLFLVLGGFFCVLIREIDTEPFWREIALDCSIGVRVVAAIR